jgi:hypothetical protein
LRSQKCTWRCYLVLVEARQYLWYVARVRTRHVANYQRESIVLLADCGIRVGAKLEGLSERHLRALEVLTKSPYFVGLKKDARGLHDLLQRRAKPPKTR